MLNFCDFIQVYVFTTNHHLKVQQIFPKPSSCFLYVVPHNLESQNLGFVDVKRFYI